MARPVIILAACLIAAIPSLALAQDKVFRTWFEAPQTVMAGETVQVWMWATYEEDGQPPSSLQAHIDSAAGSIEVSGDLTAFANISQLREGMYYIFDRGTPDGPWLHDFITGQPFGVPGVIIDERNPLPILMFEIETTPNTTGLLHVNLRPFADQVVPTLSWFDPLAGPDYWIITTDPGVSLITTTTTIRVIPTPASAALLCLATLIPARRRRY